MVNGAQYTAEQFIPNLENPTFRLGADVFITLGPPKAILLSSKTTQDIRLAGLPLGMLPVFRVKVAALKGVGRPFDRFGYNLTPTFSITDFKSQGMTLPRAFLSLLDRKAPTKNSDFITTYVQLSLVERDHWLKFRLPPRLAEGIGRWLELGLATHDTYKASLA
ncbi:hypothetical protein F4781DRAFT_48782 [Annulohypoxylon bovei var. microspora]|nr:hypothetical protein F4781DRAFT_48782 [Annulohypoxylon bovei var. microspora]